jgi:hypothetical protein
MKPQILLESIFVGIYSMLLSIIVIQLFNLPLVFNIFIIGFLKHYISGIIGLQHYYCSMYNNCEKFDLDYLILESIGEGYLFLITYFILSKLLGQKGYTTFFMIGILLHITFEQLNGHSLFCNTRCKKEIKNIS